MPFYVNSGGGINPALASAASAGIARQYNDQYGLQRGALDLNYAQMYQQGDIARNQLGYNYAALGQQDVQSQRQALLERAQQILDAHKAQAQFDLGTNQLNAQTWYQGETLGQNRYATDLEEAYRRAALTQQGDLGFAGINASANNAAMQNQLGYAQLDASANNAANALNYNYADLGQRAYQFDQTQLAGQQDDVFRQQVQDWTRQYQQGELAVKQQDATQQGAYYNGLINAKTAPQLNPFQFGLTPTGAKYGNLDFGLPPDPSKNLNVTQDNLRSTLAIIVNSIAKNPITGQLQPTPEQSAALQQLYQMGGVATNPFSQPSAPLTIQPSQSDNPYAYEFNNTIAQGAQYAPSGPLAPNQVGGGWNDFGGGLKFR